MAHSLEMYVSENRPGAGRADVNTIMDRVRRFSSMALVAGRGRHAVTHSIDEDRWIVCVRPINGNVSTGSEPRDVVSGDNISKARPENENPTTIVPFWVIYHQVIWMPREIERDTRVTQIRAGTTAVKRSSSLIKGARMNCADQEPSQKELTSFISNHIPENRTPALDQSESSLVHQRCAFGENQSGKT